MLKYSEEEISNLIRLVIGGKDKLTDDDLNVVEMQLYVLESALDSLKDYRSRQAEHLKKPKWIKERKSHKQNQANTEEMFQYNYVSKINTSIDTLKQIFGI
jgi:hypothetical protein